ncbi:MAG: hypothetical protein H0X50_06965 [Nitrosopumilus sp.]|nr:hypothetical protein [Nitrosopumilus sp.]
MKYWIVLIIPLILYLIGSGLIISLPNDSVYRFYMRIIFRAGTIGSSLLFGLAFFVISKNVASVKVKDYLIITAVGISTVGIANEISGLQQTYGVAAHSLVLLFSYLVGLGLYSSAIFLSQDGKLRTSIRKTALEQSKLLVNIGAIQLKQEIERKVLGAAKQQEETLTGQSGVQSSLTDEEMQYYLSNVLRDIKVIKNYEDILKKEKEIMEESSEFLVCFRFSGIRLSYNNYFEIYKKLMDKYRNGEHRGIRWVTTVDKNSMDLIKEFLKIGVQMRHVKEIPPIDFALSDKEMLAMIHAIENRSNSDVDNNDGDTMQNLLVTSEPAYIDHFVSIFRELWNNGLDAKDRIIVIEEGLEPEFLEVITDHEKAGRILVDLTTSIMEEALVLLPNDKAMLRVDKLGVVEHLINASKNGAAIKIICPTTENNINIIKRIEKYAPQIGILNGNESTVGMVITDNSKYIRVEMNQPDAEIFIQAIGFTIYSNSKSSVNSYKSIFELLWKERVLNDELKKADIMQKEFISIAAHELRSPIQPILASSQLLHSSDMDKIKQKEFTNIIIRNAKRLQSLSQNILDASRIESKTLELYKDCVILNDLISSSIEDVQKTSGVINNNNNNINVKIEIDCDNDCKDVIVDVDSDKIIQVLSNLLSNAVKFTQNGNISIQIKRAENNQAIVSTRDYGTGINSKILPRLFEKFVTDSNKGTGLGLYISKGIIEAHGGRIWAENNKDDKGATFSFSLPLKD